MYRTGDLARFGAMLFVILAPALAVVAIGYGLYAAIAAARRRRFDPLRRFGVIQDGRTLRRRSRLSRSL